jgi:iron complex transport system substrate-binding protein
LPKLLKHELKPHFLLAHIIVDALMSILRHRIFSLTVTLIGLMAHARASETAPRLVSLSPHITELLFAAGAGGALVGVDDSSDYPAQAAAIPRIGEPAALDVEGLLKLNPTLILLWDSGTPALRKAQLERLNFKLLVTEQRTLDDIAATLIQFGHLAGTQAVADAAARQYQFELRQLRSQYAARRHLTVFYQVWDRPLYTLSGGHVVSEILSLCGGENVFAELSTLAPAIDKEAVLKRDPQVILIGATGADAARQARDWNRFPSLRAVRKHQVFSVDPSLLGRMAPRILQGVRQVCTLLDRVRDET